jgi:hypothetical protein
MAFKDLVLKFGRSIGRTESEGAEASPRAVLWKKRFAFIISGAIVLAFAALFFFQERLWSTSKLEVEIPWSSWHTLFTSFQPATSILLASPTTKADADHTQRVQDRKAEAFWIGTEIPSEKLKEAAGVEATFLSIGYMSAEYQLWLDEDLVMTGSEKIAQSVYVPISKERLLSGRPLQVTLEVMNKAGWTYPDMLELFFKGPGFLTAESATLHTKEMDFLTNVRPSVLLTLNMVTALAFLFFWTSAPKRKEYFMMFLYCSVLAMLQAHLTNFGQNLMNPKTGYRLDIVLFCLEGALPLAIALAFARTKQIYAQVIGFTFLAAPLVMVCFLDDSQSLIKFSYWIQVYLAPPLLALGAIVCFFQAKFLHFDLHAAVKTKQKRINRLVFFGIGLTVIAAIHVMQSHTGFSESFRFWCEAHFGMVIFLATLVVSDYHETETRLGRAPFSSFHRPENLNVPVMGAVMSLDLKRSEVLLNKGARIGDSSILIKETIALMKHALTSFGGTIILTDGDSIKCFFKGDQDAGIALAVSALDHVQTEIKNLTQTFQVQYGIPEHYEISFRAGIAHGTIRPFLGVLNGKDYPEWEQVGQSQPFLESARLMEAEPKANTSSDSFILIFKNLERPPQGWIQQSVMIQFKHGQTVQAVSLKPFAGLRAVA